MINIGDKITIKSDITECFEKHTGKDCPFHEGLFCQLNGQMLHAGKSYTVQDVTETVNFNELYYVGRVTDDPFNNYYMLGCLEQQDKDNEI